jgi:HPt (histidine-containing phosphotransfer) domain-containing protein
MEASGDDSGFMRELVTTFTEQMEIELVRLHAASDGGDIAEARNLAHKCKGSCQACGAHRLAELCHEAEAMAARGESAGMQGLVARIEREFKALCPLLLEWVERRGTQALV